MKRFMKHLRDRSGQNMVEYALLLGMVFTVGTVALRGIGSGIQETAEGVFPASHEGTALSQGEPLTTEEGEADSLLAAADARSESATSRTFYVDAQNGSDANDGTMASRPWRTLANVNGGSFLPGDSILFKRGCTWREVLTAPSSGTSTDRITFGAYGTGPRPVLKGSRAPDEDGCTWRSSRGGTNEYYLVKDGRSPGYRMPGDWGDRPGWLWYREGPTRLHKGSVGALQDGRWGWGDNDGLSFETIYVRNDAGTPGPLEIPQTKDSVARVIGKNYLVFRDLSVQFGDLTGGMLVSDAAHHITFEDCEFAYNFQTGLGVHGNRYSDHDAYVTIRRCVAHDNGGHGIAVDGEEGPPVRKTRYVTIEECEAYNTVLGYRDVDGYGLKFTFVDKSKILNSHSHHNYAPGINLDGNRGAPIDVQGGCDDNEIAYNVVHDNGSWGIPLEISSRNRVHHNRIYDNGLRGSWKGGAIACEWYSQDNEIHNNLIYGRHSSPAIGISDVSTGNRVLNNTVIAAHYGISVSRGAEPGTEIFNNLVASPSYHCWLGTEVGLQSDHNSWFGSGKKFIVEAHPWPPNPFGLSGWRSLSGQDLHSITADPQFVAPESDDYSLSGGSPCVDAGKDVGLDFSGAAPDMGAFESGSAGTQPEPVFHTLSVSSSPVEGAAISGGPAGTTNYSASLEENSSVALTAPVSFADGQTDYQFVTWVVNGVQQPGGQLSLGFNIGAATTAVAVYAVVDRQLTVQSTPVAGVQIEGSPAGTTAYGGAVPDGTAVNLSAPAGVSDGSGDYEFVQWTLSGAEQPEGQTSLSFSMAEDTTAVAVYAVAERTLTVQSTPLAGVQVGGSPAGTTDYSAVMARGAAVSLGAPASLTEGETDYEFVRWVLNGAGQPEGQASVAFSLSEHTSAVAVYAVVEHTLTVESAPVSGVQVGGSPAGLTGYSASVRDNTEVSLTAPATCADGQTDYEFVRWVLDGVDRPAGLTSVAFTMAQDTAAVAVYAVVDRTLRVESTPVTGIEVTASPPQPTNFTTVRADNSLVTVSAPSTYSKDGTDYTFARWQLNGIAQADGQTTIDFVINQDAKAVAVYEEVAPQQAAHMLWVESSPVRRVPIAGSLAGTTDYKMELPHGTPVTLTAPATFTKGNKEYAFVRWSGHPAGQQTIQFQVDEDMAKTAYYEPASNLLEHTLWLQSTPIQGIALDGSPAVTTDYVGTLPAGTLITLTAPATVWRNGQQYTFMKWDGAPAGERTIRLTLTEDMAKTARYK
ncbi:MAG: right-handed parallel beta-helix repeat-containing protein [Planctomycetota bacterium]|jgi:parallel beta-helix repeat protein